MTAGDRLSKYVEDQAMSWSDRLKAWLNTVYGLFIKSTLGIFLPPPVQEKLFPQTTEAAEVVRDLLLGIVGAITGTIQAGMPYGRIFSYTQDRIQRSHRLDPATISAIWLRDREAWQWLWDDLKDLGWSDDRIKAAQELSKWLPPPAQLILWSAREVFEKDMREKYGLDDGAGKLDRTLFYKQGLDDEQIDNNWAAHWEHASYLQMVELLRRGLLTSSRQVPTPPTTPGEWARRDEEGVKELFSWYGLVEIAPFWRDLLTELSWEIPTRVDVRRWWDMRTISEEELYSIYHRQGYHGKDLENYVLWTKVYTDFPGLLARWQKGWLTLDDVRAELAKIGMPEERIETMIQEKIEPEQPERLIKEKDLTAAEIVRGVKREVINWDEGIDLLMDLGYDNWEAEYKLAIDVAALEGSPDTFQEFKDITTKYRQAIRRVKPTMPEELVKAADELVRISKEVEDLAQALAEEEKQLGDFEVLPAEATARRDELRTALRKARAEKKRLQTAYDRQVAEWKQSQG